MVKVGLGMAAALLAGGMLAAQTPASNTNSGGSNQSTSVATQPNNNNNPVNQGATQAQGQRDANRGSSPQAAGAPGSENRGDDLSGARASGNNSGDAAAQQSGASSQSKLGNADPNDTRAQTDAYGNPVAAHHDTRGNTWMWLVIGIIVVAAVVRYVARGREPERRDLDTGKRRDDIRRAG